MAQKIKNHATASMALENIKTDTNYRAHTNQEKKSHLSIQV